MEREWRNKELAMAKKKKEDLEQLHLAREQQIEDIRRAQAIELAREEQEFHQVNYLFTKGCCLFLFVVEVAKVQAKQHELEMEKRQRKKDAAVCLREELLKQINEKEKSRIQSIQEKFEEGNALRLEKELRDMRVKDYVQEKVHKLRYSPMAFKLITKIVN